MKIVHVEQMRDIEAEIDSSGISYATLMERAGKAIADYALDIVADISQPRIMIFGG
jgi:NAD(P)H-hydrate repair Nnr-like enzyme with NAD(P)H-hydrate epimerase domain